MYWVELSFALCSLPIFTTRSFKTVSFSAPSSPNLIFFWGLGLLASSFTTVNNQPAKLFFPLFFAGIFLQRDMKNTWNYGLAQKHFVVDPDFCGDHQWTCRGRQRYVLEYLFLPIWQKWDLTNQHDDFTKKLWILSSRSRFTEVEVRKVKKKSWNRGRKLFSHILTQTRIGFLH